MSRTNYAESWRSPPGFVHLYVDITITFIVLLVIASKCYLYRFRAIHRYIYNFYQIVPGVAIIFKIIVVSIILDLMTEQQIVNLAL